MNFSSDSERSDDPKRAGKHDVGKHDVGYHDVGYHEDATIGEPFELSASSQAFLARLSTLEPASCDVDLVAVAFESGRRLGAEENQLEMGSSSELRTRSTTAHWLRHPAWAFATVSLLVLVMVRPLLPWQGRTSRQITRDTPDATAPAGADKLAEDVSQQTAQGALGPRNASTPPAMETTAGLMDRDKYGFWADLVALAIDGLSSETAEDARIMTAMNPRSSDLYSPQKRRWVLRLMNRPQDAMTRPLDSEWMALREFADRPSQSLSTEPRSRKTIDERNLERKLEYWMNTEGF